MLDFLVTSAVRRRLLELLWSQGAKGSATELAALVGAGYASAYRELKAMKRYALVLSALEDGREVYSANVEHPAADALRKLISVRSRPRVVDRVDEQLRGQLRTLGAPLSVEPVPVPREQEEEILVRAVNRSHMDAGLARALPLCFWNQRNVLDPDRLLAVAKEHKEKNAVGFFLDLTTVLTDDRRFSQWANLFRDHRVRVTDFFVAPVTKESEALTEANTPEVARAWGLRMNMDLAAFKTLFGKFENVRS
jgi:Fe2+ or Zn2+ uptake regulation protein